MEDYRTHLLDVVRALASDSATQMEWLVVDKERRQAVGVDELALTFDGWFRAGPYHIELGKLTQVELDSMRPIDEALDAISGQVNAHLWTAEALQSAPEWEHIRKLAARALEVLGA